MKMTMDQTKLVALTMELDLKTREYNQLCEELDTLKSNGVNPNDPQLGKLMEKFRKNYTEIEKIKKLLDQLNKV